MLTRDMKHKNSSIAIVAGGRFDLEVLPRIRKTDYIIGVDRGAYWLLEHKIIPDIAIGDFDSVSKKEFQTIESNVNKIIRHTPEKDATDLELAVDHAIGLKPKEAGIFGAIGTRFDHNFAGIQVLLKLSSHNIYGYIVDNFNEIYIVRHRSILQHSDKFPYVSIFPLTDKAIVTLSGCRYNVSRREFVRGSTLGVSNELTISSGHVTVHTGEILLIRSRD